MLQERCRVVSVLGMGGIGKSALSVTFMHQVAPAFQHVVFRSLRDASPCQDLLTDCLQVLSPGPLPALPGSRERRMDLLLACLQRQRCLLVLDNLETLLQEHDQEGSFRAGYQDYAALLSRVAQTPHQSCLLLTSRESPAEFEPRESNRASVRALRLAGLEQDACEHLFEERDVVGTPHDRLRLVQWSPDGMRLASCGDDGTICLWRVGLLYFLFMFLTQRDVLQSLPFERYTEDEQ